MRANLKDLANELKQRDLLVTVDKIAFWSRNHQDAGDSQDHLSSMRNGIIPSFAHVIQNGTFGTVYLARTGSHDVAIKAPRVDSRKTLE